MAQPTKAGRRGGGLSRRHARRRRGAPALPPAGVRGAAGAPGSGVRTRKPARRLALVGGCSRHVSSSVSRFKRGRVDTIQAQCHDSSEAVSTRFSSGLLPAPSFASPEPSLVSHVASRRVDLDDAPWLVRRHLRLHIWVRDDVEHEDAARREGCVERCVDLRIVGELNAVGTIGTREGKIVGTGKGAALGVVEAELNPAEDLVVDDDDHQARVHLDGRSELIERHLEATVAGDDDARCAGAALRRGDDAGTECVAHRAETLRGEHD
mmetsp:Transcript_39702/g.131388  ORF Transcript_39702/g.131388 Transcript_39702/m.131388 type:complete len:266 (+) Transcript_39702:446-1243(+)